VTHEPAPIVFIHYGDSKYLRFTLESARRFNPGRRVLLLGDAANRRYASLGIDHRLFDEYRYGDKVEAFEKVFQLIAGREFEARTYGRRWTHFNFLKWFVVENFLERAGVDAFWTFDSDVLLLDELGRFEAALGEFDYTVANDLHQMVGFVRRRRTVEAVTRTILDLFSDEAYLAAQRAVMAANPRWGFTIMRAFDAYFHAARPRVARLFNAPELFGDRIFVDALGAPGLEPFRQAAVKDREGALPLLLEDGAGGVYVERRADGERLRVSAVNLSWLDYGVMKRIFERTRPRRPPVPPSDGVDKPLRPLDLSTPLAYRLKNAVVRMAQAALQRPGRRGV